MEDVGRELGPSPLRSFQAAMSSSSSSLLIAVDFPSFNFLFFGFVDEELGSWLPAFIGTVDMLAAILAPDAGGVGMTSEGGVGEITGGKLGASTVRDAN